MTDELRMPAYIRTIRIFDSSPVPTASVHTVRRLVKEQIRQWQHKKLKPFNHISEIFDCPERLLRLVKEGIIEKPEIVLDKGTGEFLESKVRGTRIPNRFTMAG